MSTKTATLQRTEELVRMHVDAFNQRHLEKGERNVTSDFEWTIVPFDRTFRGPKGYLESNQLWIDGFPDGKIKVIRLITQGDVAFLEFHGKGTNTGPLDGPQGRIAPTGKQIEMPFILKRPCFEIRVINKDNREPLERLLKSISRKWLRNFMAIGMGVFELAQRLCFIT